MSDNDRKNPHETRHDHEHHDPLGRLTRIFNPNKQNGNQNDHSSLQTDQSASHLPKSASSPPPSHDDDFDLSFLEAELENNLTNNLPLDNQRRQWGNRETNSDTLSKTSLNRLEQNKFLPEERHYTAINHDEEQILDALSPLPIQKNQTPPKRTIPTRTDPSFGKSGFNERSENFFFDELDKHDNIKETTTQSAEQTHHLPQTASQQKEGSKIQQNHESNQNFYSTPVNHPYKISADQEIWATEYYSDLSHSSKETNTFSSSSDLVSERQDTARNERVTDFPLPLDSTQVNKQSEREGFSQKRHTTDYPQFYEEEFSKQETYAETTQEYHNIQTPYINSAENISEQNNEKEKTYSQNNLNHIHSSSETPHTGQKERFFAHNSTDRDSPPPNVNTYKFAEEIVEKTGPIMVPEVPYEAPEYDVPTDDLKEEFADVLNVGNVSADDFSRHQQHSDVFNEIFHQTMENPKENIHINSQNQNTNYSPTDNVEYHSSSFTADPLYRGTDEISTHASNTSPLKNFIFGKNLTKSVVLLTLIAVGFFSYFHFFVPSQKNENAPIIRADDTPFKFKQETTEKKNDVAHNLDIYKQTTEESEKQENTQQSLIDSSEQPEDLTELDQQEATSLSSSSLNQSAVEDAVTEAINHTIPTREVQTVIVNQDGTVVLAPKQHTEEKPTDEQEEKIDQIADNQPQDSSALSVDESNINNEETEQTFTSDIDKVIAENTSFSNIEGKVIPLPSHPERNAEQQKHVDSRPPSSSHVTTQNSENYYVQLASQPTHALATISLKNIKLRFGFLIGDRPLNIQSALIPEKGTYYRVRIQTHNRNDAINLCEDIKNSGGSCFITR
ncbi:SPOR domain-containing protein [Bartonella harrusi]|uniref:SPOR domain-containing protein n=1 Tax=Bartonella harrusi TaxID=2961895 RepID=A0ABY5EUD6_9HYPH|nr:SPOR domain-containing protein [Bartonella harrusi]UTO29012.1 SPOR domain-containing protein [Bartonella harrusi]